MRINFTYRRYPHSATYNKTLKKLFKVCVAIGTTFHNTVVRHVGHVGGDGQSKEVTRLTRSEMYKILKTVLNRKQFNLKVIPKHIWCELVIHSIKHDFVDRASRSWITVAVYRLYLRRECLAKSSTPLARFDAEHESFLENRGSNSV